jgi:hypothetical protein
MRIYYHCKLLYNISHRMTKVLLHWLLGWTCLEKIKALAYYLWFKLVEWLDKITDKIMKLVHKLRTIRSKCRPKNGFIPSFMSTLVSPQSYFNEVGHLPVCKQSKRGWKPSKCYSHIVMSQLYETKIP